jgi:hypothetical protein
MNSRPTHQIDSKNRLMADEWNCQKRYFTFDPYIINEKKDTVDLEIINEYRVTASVWN